TATTSTPGAISGMKSPGGTTLTIGTLIMIRVPVRVDSAVAAWPAPMLATSRSASSRAVLRSVVPLSPDGVLRGLVISEKAGSVHDKGGRAIPEDSRAAEKSLAVIYSVELLHHDFLLSHEFIDDQRGLALRELDENNLSAGRLLRWCEAYALAQPDRGEEIVTDRHDLFPLRLEEHRLGQAEGLEHVGEWDGVDFPCNPRQQR